MKQVASLTLLFALALAFPVVASAALLHDRLQLRGETLSQPAMPQIQNTGGGSFNNGGTQSGNGGNGGNAAAGGALRTGNATSSVQVINIINATLVRIGF